MEQSLPIEQVDDSDSSDADTDSDTEALSSSNSNSELPCTSLLISAMGIIIVSLKAEGFVL